MIIDIANWPDTRIEHWRTLLKARAIENQCYVVGVNRVGDDPKLHYNGFSSVFDPMGIEVVAVENEEKVIAAEIDKTYVDNVRQRLPFLKDIRLI
jgi:predicted amidohydrolase